MLLPVCSGLVWILFCIWLTGADSWPVYSELVWIDGLLGADWCIFLLQSDASCQLKCHTLQSGFLLYHHRILVTIIPGNALKGWFKGCAKHIDDIPPHRCRRRLDKKKLGLIQMTCSGLLVESQYWKLFNGKCSSSVTR